MSHGRTNTTLAFLYTWLLTCAVLSCVGAEGRPEDSKGVYRTNGLLSDIICMDVCQSISLLMMVSGGSIVSSLQMLKCWHYACSSKFATKPNQGGSHTRAS
jgi:hypothetical protein